MRCLVGGRRWTTNLKPLYIEAGLTTKNCSLALKHCRLCKLRSYMLYLPFSAKKFTTFGSKLMASILVSLGSNAFKRKSVPHAIWYIIELLMVNLSLDM